MYNRYVRNDNGVYHRIPMPQSDPPPRHNAQETRSNTSHSDHEHTPSGHSASSAGSPPEKEGLLSGILEKLKLDEIDTGDLLLLVLLFLLFRDGEDDELLIALGLLLIL